MMNAEKLDHSELFYNLRVGGSLDLLETIAPAILNPRCWVHEELDRRRWAALSYCAH